MRRNDTALMSLKQLFSEINAYNPYVPSKEKEYIKRIKAGDLIAKEQLFRYNLRIVAKIAYKYINRGILLEDLIQTGAIGLYRAIDSYKIERNAKFLTCADFYIKDEIKSLFYIRYGIRYPENTQDAFIKIWELQKNSNNNLTDEQLVELAKLSPYHIKIYQQFIIKCCSIDHLKELYGVEHVDFSSRESSSNSIDDEIVTKLDRIHLLNRLKKILTKKQYEVIIRRYGLIGSGYMEVREVVEELGTNNNAISFLEREALKKIRKDERVKQFLSCV